MVPTWVGRYIGLPFEDRGRSFDAVDCWGLLCLIYEVQYEITLPSYSDYAYVPEERNELGAFLLSEAAKADFWIDLGKDLDAPDVGDGILVRAVGQPVHVGCVVDPIEGWMLHTQIGVDSCLEQYKDPLWKNRVLGFWRHADRK